VIVLAGGFGTRLKSVVSDVPKPLAPVEGHPFLEYLIEDLARQGVTRVVLSLHYQAEKFDEFINKNSGRTNWPEISRVIENEPLGTGGAVKHVLKSIGHDSSFFVTNGDTLTLGAIQKIREATDERPINTIGLVKTSDPSRYGSVSTDETRNLVLGFKEKVAASSKTGDQYVYAGTAFLTANDFISTQKSIFSMENDLFPALIRKNKLHYTELEGEFIDIGIPKDYFAFPEWFRRQGLRLE